MSHTPGPWKAEQIGGDMAITISSSNRIATCNWAKTEKEYEANAHLIAAAPEMLEALILAEEALDTWEQIDEPGSAPSPLLQQIREIIISAGGTLDEE